MAKITANGATEVARWELVIPASDRPGFTDDYRAGSALLRSDGVVLRKGTVRGDRWTRWLRLKSSPSKPISAERAQAAMMARGYTLERL